MGEVDSKARAAAVEQQERQLHQWHDAIESVVRLQDAPNQELRGRTTAEAGKRIDRFIDSDPVYRAARDEYAGNDRSRRTEFRETLERSLNILERLAHRNPDVDVPLDFKDNHRYVYRLMALHLMLQANGQRDSLSDPSVLGLPAFTRPPIAIKEDRSITADSPAAAGAPEKAHEALAKNPDEDRFFELWITHLPGNVNSIAKQVDLYALVATYQDGISFPVAREILSDEDLSQGILYEQLGAVAAVARDCKEFGDGRLRSISHACNLHARATALSKAHGLHELESPLDALADEGFLSNDGKSLLIRSAAVMRDALPVTARIVERLEERSIVTADDVSKLNTAVNRFLLAGKAEDFIERRLCTALVGAIDKLDHVCNCAVLLSRKVHIDDLIVLSRESTSIVARAANREFDSVAPTNTRYGKLVRERIDAEIDILRRSDPQERQDFESAFSSLQIPASVRKAELRECLFTVAQELPAHGRTARLQKVGADLTQLAAAGTDLGLLTEMLKAPPAEVRQEALLLFISNLAHLQADAVQGLPHIVQHAHELYSRRRDGDESQNMRGPLVEAQTAINLARSGYKILALGVELPSSRYDYDILAESPTGERLGIEVKRGLASVVGKNTRMWSRAEHANSQMVRFMVACKTDGFTPVITISDFHDHTWAASPLSDLLNQIQSEFGLKPRILDGNNARECSY